MRKSIKRRLDLSGKFIQMGQSLVDEGVMADDREISLLGTILIFVGGVSLADKDIVKVTELLSLYSAKKLVESMEDNPNQTFESLKNKATNQTYEDLVDRINEKMDDIDEDDESYDIDETDED